MKIVVIGAGFGGLAAGIRLQAQGHEVTIAEKLEAPGGRASVFRQDGFTFDAGPTILTAPALIHDLFAAAGRRTADYVTLLPLDPFYHVRFEDGSVFSYSASPQDVARQVASFHPPDVAGYERFARAAAAIYDSAFPLIDRPFLRVTDLLRVAPDLVRHQAYRSVAGLVNRYVADPRLRQVFSFHPLLLGGNPFDTTAIYALIHHLEKTGGVWFAVGGTGSLVSALARVFSELGGELRCRAEVGGIEMSSAGRASGVRLTNGELLPAGAVVSNGDVADTYLRLVPERFRHVNTDRRVKRRHYAMSVFVIYFGTSRRYDELAHHEILMGPRYRGLLDDVFRRKRLASDFSLYLHRPTATDPSLAPDGCDAFYALSPVPHLGAGIDWAAAGPAYRDAIMRYLEARYLPDLSRHIVTERVVAPPYFRDTLNSWMGSAFALEPRLSQSAWFRPHNRSEDVPNLYFAGAGAHPGAGIPGVLSSGKIVADLIQASVNSGAAAR